MISQNATIHTQNMTEHVDDDLPLVCVHLDESRVVAVSLIKAGVLGQFVRIVGILQVLDGVIQTEHEVVVV